MQLAGNDSAIVSEKTLTIPDIQLEFMLNALRLVRGFHTSLFLSRCGFPLHKIKGPLQVAEQQGFIQWDVESIAPTGKGQRYLNDLLQLFMQDSDQTVATSAMQ